MKTLELKYLVPYLPYKLKFEMDFGSGEKTIYNLEGLTEDEIYFNGYDCNYLNLFCKPILKPIYELKNSDKFLSDLEIEFKIEPFIFSDLTGYYVETISCKSERVCNFTTYMFYEYLFQNHFDVFGLIEQGLAIDINTIER